MIKEASKTSGEAPYMRSDLRFWVLLTFLWGV